MPVRLRTLLLVLVLLLAALLRARDLTAPFDREFEGFQGGCWAIAARHRLEHGADRVGIFPVLNPNLAPDFEASQLAIYSNHPLTTHAIDVVVAHTLGMQEWALRLPYLLGGLAIVALVYALGLRVLGPLGALLAATLAATSPGLAFYGATVNYEDLCIPAVLLTVWAHLRWSEKGRFVDALIFAGALFLAVSIDWPAAFLAPAFAIERCLPRGRLDLWKRLRSAIFSGLACAVAIGAAVALHLVLVRWNYEQLGLPLPAESGLDGARERLALMAEPFQSGSTGAWLEAQAGHVRSMVRYEMALLGLLGTILCLMRERRCERARVVVLPGVLAGTLYLLAFAKHALDQPLFWMYLLPFLALASGFALSRACALVAPRAFSRRAAGLALALPLALLGALQWHALRERYRTGLHTEEIGTAIREATPPLTNLYVPQGAGWNMAYAYYARRQYLPVALEGTRQSVPCGAIAPVDALRDLDLAPARRAELESHVQILLQRGLSGARHALVLFEHASPALATEQNALEHALRRYAEVEEQRLGNGVRLLLVKPQDYAGEGVRRRSLHLPGPDRDAALAEISALRAAAPSCEVLYTGARTTLCTDRGPLFAKSTAVFFLDPDPTIAHQLLAPLPGSEHARRLLELGSPERAIVVRAEEQDFAAALRAAMPHLPAFAAAQGRLVCRLSGPDPAPGSR